eukprot:SAG22_NODE_64_length_23238_cov_83.185566_16_plen_268_part_00
MADADDEPADTSVDSGALDDEFEAALARRAARRKEENEEEAYLQQQLEMAAGAPPPAAADSVEGAAEEPVQVLELGGESYLLDALSLEVYTLEENPQLAGYWDPETAQLLPLPSPGGAAPPPEPAPAPEPKPAQAPRDATEETPIDDSRGAVFTAAGTYRAGGHNAAALDLQSLKAATVEALPFVPRELWSDKPETAKGLEAQRAALYGWLNAVLRLLPNHPAVQAMLQPKDGSEQQDQARGVVIEHVELTHVTGARVRPAAQLSCL